MRKWREYRPGVRLLSRHFQARLDLLRDDPESQEADPGEAGAEAEPPGQAGGYPVGGLGGDLRLLLRLRRGRGRGRSRRG